MRGEKQGGNSGSKRGGGAGAHGLDIGSVAEIETAEAVSGVGGKAICGVGEAGAAGGLNPATDAGVGTIRVTAAGCCEGVERGSVVAVVGE
jgi:hypothetical protein